MAEYIRQDHHLPHGSLEPHITNADRIRAMTDEELADKWWKWVDCGECPARPNCSMLHKDCIQFALEWLKKEVEE